MGANTPLLTGRTEGRSPLQPGADPGWRAWPAAGTGGGLPRQRHPSSSGHTGLTSAAGARPARSPEGAGVTCLSIRPSRRERFLGLPLEEHFLPGVGAKTREAEAKPMMSLWPQGQAVRGQPRNNLTASPPLGNGADRRREAP